jgi:DNA polymerase III subunit delta'
MLKKNDQLNWPLVGNRQITEFLDKIIAKDEVAGTYIFCGPDNLGKTTTAIYFAQILLCQNRQPVKNLPCGVCSSCSRFSAGNNDTEQKEGKDEAGEQDTFNYAHGDFHLIKKDKDKKNVSIEQVRDFIHVLNMSSFLNSYKIGIIKHADSLSNEAANALLKTLEEPKEKVVIILIAQNINQINATIVSRSKILHFYPVAANTIYDYLLTTCQASRSEAKNYSRLALGRPALAKKFFADEDFNKKYQERMRIFLNFFSQSLNDRLAAVEQVLGKKGSGQETTALAKRMLEIWQGLTRDCVLLTFGQTDLVQHHLVSSELEQIGKKASLAKLLTVLSLLQQGQEQLAANVNPKLALENVAINL